MFVKYNDGSELYIDSSRSIGHALMDILRIAQLKIEDGDEVVYDKESCVLDIIETIGVKSIEWNDGPYVKATSNKMVNNFIERFHYFEHDVTETFTNNCCYWFAEILHKRFPESRIMFCKKRKMTESDEELIHYGLSPEVIEKGLMTLHFVTEIDGKQYDITGDVTGKYETVPWDEYPDNEMKRYIIDECTK